MNKLIPISISIVLVAFAAYWGFFNADGSDVAFQSSDGEWADSEIMFKGRTFDDIVVSFELYKLRCAPSVTLQRTTQQPKWYEPVRWFDDFASSKWRVPYANALPNAKGGYYPPVGVKHCANEPTSMQEGTLAEKQAKEYLSRIGP